MGEKDETKHEGAKTAAAGGGEKAAAGGGGTKQDGPATAVLKLELHCGGCAKKVRRSVSQLEGVEKVKADWMAKKLTVTGNVDPTLLREKVEIKTKKKVELLSPPPKNAAAAGGGEKKAEEKKKTEEVKPEKKTEENKPDEIKKPKEAVVALTTVVMKTKLHCDGCATKIKRIISKNFEGVESITTDLDKDSITVTGTMNVVDLTAYLKEKLKRVVEVLPSKKEKKGDGGEKKEKIAADGDKKSGGEKGDGGGEATKVEVSKMEHHGYNARTHYAVPMAMHSQSYGHHDYGAPPMYHDHQQGYSGTGHMVQYAAGPPPPPPTYVSMDDQMFSDENPNGCFVM